MTTRLNHCCPVCGNPVGAKRWFWGAWIWARWQCAACGTLLRFDLRRRLLLGLFVGLLCAVMMGIAVLLILFRVTLWIWALPLLAIFIAGMILIFVRGDRIIVAEHGKEAVHVSPNDT